MKDLVIVYSRSLHFLFIILQIINPVMNTNFKFLKKRLNLTGKCLDLIIKMFAESIYAK